MKALVFKDKLEFTTDYPQPKREKGEALIRIVYAGICNTDREIMKGYKGFTGILGHEGVGVVEEADNKKLIGKTVVFEINIGCGECEECKSGMQKHCYNRRCVGITKKDGCFAEYLTLREDLLFVVDDSISKKEALFSEPLAAAAIAVMDSQLKKEDKILLLGDGRLSYLIYISLVYYLKKLGVKEGEIKNHLTVKGHNDNKLEMFNLATVTKELVNKEKYFTLVFEATGSESGISEALGATKPRGRVVVKTTRAGLASLDLNLIVVNELTLIGSRCGDFSVALDILKTHPYLPETEWFELKDFEKAFCSKSFKVAFRI